MIRNYKIVDVKNNTLSSRSFLHNQKLEFEFLGIDRHIAQIIGSAAPKLSNNIDNNNGKLQTENYIIL
jgi:hypothetical protein